MTSPLFREFRRLIYTLKRQYGQPVQLCRTTNNSTDFATGVQFQTTIITNIRRAVMMPAKDIRKFMHMQTDISRKQDFAMGGMFDTRSRAVIISQRDLPASFPIDLNCHVVLNATRWEVKQLEETESQEYLVLTIQEIDATLVGPEYSQPIPTPPGAVDFTYTAPFDYTTTSPLLFGSLLASDVIVAATVTLATPFSDPTATINLGTDIATDALLTAAEINPLAVSTFSSRNQVGVDVTGQLALEVHPGTSTVGSGSATVVVRRGP